MKNRFFGLAFLGLAVLALFAACSFAGDLEALKKEVLGESSGNAKPSTKWYTDNTAATKYTITTADELAGLAKIVNAGDTFEGSYDFAGKTITLGADIDLSAYGKKYNNGRGWIPIGHNTNSTGYFKGTFDGNNHTISNLYINNKSYTHTGLFGELGLYVVTGEQGVYNLNLADVDITSVGNYVGAVAGHVVGDFGHWIIKNCSVTGKISGVSNTGGVAGYVNYNCHISKCSFSGTVNGDRSVGGIVGEFIAADMINCYSTGWVRGNTNVGGVAGNSENGGGIKNCYSTSSVIGAIINAGGIVGSNENPIINCYSTGNIQGDSNVGGIAGVLKSGYTSIGNCYAAGPITGNSNVGGVAGIANNDCTINRCAALNGEISSANAADTATFGRVAGVSTALLNNLAFNNMLVDNSIINAGTGDTTKHGADISKEEATTQTTYSGNGTRELDWPFGNDDDHPWKWGNEAYPLPVLYWQDAASYPPLPGHLK